MARMDEATRKRVRAGRRMLAGQTPAEAAKAVGVARQTAYTWKARLDEGGIDALRAMATGRPAQLDASQLKGLRAALLQGALAHGFGTELWTLKRVRSLVQRQYGVTFTELHGWRLLGAMGFSSQKPERRATTVSLCPNHRQLPNTSTKSSLARRCIQKSHAAGPARVECRRLRSDLMPIRLERSTEGVFYGPTGVPLSQA